MATNEQGLGWRDVAPETLWRLLSLAFGLDQQLPPPHWDLASTDSPNRPPAAATPDNPARQAEFTELTG